MANQSIDRKARHDTDNAQSTGAEIKAMHSKISTEVVKNNQEIVNVGRACIKSVLDSIKAILLFMVGIIKKITKTYIIGIRIFSKKVKKNRLYQVA